MSSQQSWATWLLDSYASSVSPVTETFDLSGTDNQHSSSNNSSPDPASSHPSSARSMASTSSSFSTTQTSSVSPYGPYAKTGRGGAGNFVWQSEINHEPKDIEAQRHGQHPSLGERRKAAAKLEHINTSEAIRGRKVSATCPHVHMGRGGAGNYTTGSNAPGILSASSTTTTTSASPSSPATASPAGSKAGPAPFVATGRGGAGNFAGANEASRQAEREREQKQRAAAERQREAIVDHVQSTLKAPPGAWLGGRRKSTHLPDDQP